MTKKLFPPPFIALYSFYISFWTYWGFPKISMKLLYHKNHPGVPSVYVGKCAFLKHKGKNKA